LSNFLFLVTEAAMFDDDRYYNLLYQVSDTGSFELLVYAWYNKLLSDIILNVILRIISHVGSCRIKKTTLHVCLLPKLHSLICLMAKIPRKFGVPHILMFIK
jgi:hypothetical protein